MRLPRLPYKESSTRQQSLFLIRTDWIIAAVGVVILIALVPLALTEYELAKRAVFLGCGALVALDIVDSAARLIENRKRAGFLFLVIGVVGLILLVTLPREWSFEYARGRLYPDTGRASVLLVYGLLAGLVAGASKLLWGPSTRGEALKQRREWLRERWELMRAGTQMMAMVGAIALGVFAFLFAAYVAFWYVLAPLVRFFLE